MPAHAFLSPQWIDAARSIHQAHLGAADPPSTKVRMNLVIDTVPFGAGQLDAHLDTSNGIVDIDLGHLEAPDVKVTLDYPTAKAILVDGDSQAGMAAFMAGKIRVEGDMSKLLAFQATPATAQQAAVAEQIRAITE